jgi:Domain of unknown function (DUF4350)
MSTVTARLAPGTGGPGTGGPGIHAGRAGGAAVAWWRRWRAPALLVAVILVGGTVIALLQAGPSPHGPLDPRDTGPDGTHALAALLAGQGKQVATADTAAQAVAEVTGPGTALVVTSPWLLSPASLRALAAAPADLLAVGPGRGALAVLAPGVTPAGQVRVNSRPPRCTWPGARLAGPASTGGPVLGSAPPGAWRCYPAGRPGSAGVSLVRYNSGGHTVSVLAAGAPLTNYDLGRGGNAALALNLLAPDSRIVWLVPSPALPAVAGTSVTALIPRGADLVIAELAVAVVLAALWRMRRFGPLVFEPLPVVVRASETVEGHAGLYRARRARDRAAAALRAATVARITARTGLPQATPPDVVCQDVAARTGRPVAEISAMLFGADPPDDTALVTLAADLDTLEGQVLTQ